MAIATWELEHHEHCCPSAHPARPDLRVVPEPAAGRVRRPSARVYARRRMAVLVVGVGVLAVGAMVIAGAATVAPPVEAPAGATAPAVVAPVADAAEPMVVAEGETIWGLVLPHVPAGADAQAYVTAVLDHNGLEATAVAPGTVVRLP